MADIKKILQSPISFPVWFLVLIVVSFGATLMIHGNGDDAGNGGGGDDSFGYTCFANMVTDTTKSSCAVESWGPWTDEKKESSQSCYNKVAQTRVGTGYLSVYSETYDANGCTPNYSATSYKKACQVKVRKVSTVRNTAKAGCAGASTSTPDTNFDTGEVSTEVVETTEGGDIKDRKTYNNTRQLLADAFELKLIADPQIVRQGNPTILKWSARGVLSCVLNGGDDSWTYKVPSTRTKDILRGISGQEKTSPIQSEIVYKLSCVKASDNSRVEKTVKIKVVPNWREQ